MAASAGKLTEHDFNLGLSAAMGACCVHPGRIGFIAERLGLLPQVPGGAVDVLAVGDGLKPVAMEGEYNPARTADSDAVGRLGKALTQRLAAISAVSKIETAVAVRYPAAARNWPSVQATKTALLNGARLEYAVHEQPTGRWPASGWLSGDVHSLTSLVCALAAAGDIAAAAETAAAATAGAAAVLGPLMNRTDLDRMAEAVGRPSGADALQIAAVCWLNALLFQDRIAGRHRVATRAACHHSGGQLNLAALLDAWRKIEQIDYSPVYRPARESLNIAEQAAGTQAAARAAGTVSAAAAAAQVQTLGLFDIGGELYQRVLHDRDNAAAYYTRPEIAVLLARVTVDRAAPPVWLKTGEPPPPAGRCESRTWPAAPGRCCVPRTTASGPRPAKRDAPTSGWNSCIGR